MQLSYAATGHTGCLLLTIRAGFNAGNQRSKRIRPFLLLLSFHPKVGDKGVMGAHAGLKWTKMKGTCVFLFKAKYITCLWGCNYHIIFLFVWCRSCCDDHEECWLLVHTHTDILHVATGIHCVIIPFRHFSHFV